MKTGFIGTGKMGEAIMAAMINARALGAPEVFACDISADRRRLLKKRLGVNVYSKNHLVIGAVRVVFLAVKPQNLDELLAEIAGDITKKHLVVSIAAGKSISLIESLLPEARVIRVMPNLPCLVSEGMSAFCAGTKATAADKSTVTRLLSSFGQALELPETKFDAVTALSGSGPAFLAYILDAMVDAAVNEGLTRPDALLLAEQTMLGTSRLLIEKKIDPRDLIKSVTSPQGTTAAGLAVLDKSGACDVVRKAIVAAARRSKELSAI